MNTDKQRNNTSGYKCVFLTKYGKYQTSLSINNKSTFIGTFDTAIEAAKVYDAVVRFYYPDIAYTNFDEVFIEPLSVKDARAKYKKV